MAQDGEGSQDAQLQIETAVSEHAARDRQAARSRRKTGVNSQLRI
jgi:hypothetical protein